MLLQFEKATSKDERLKHQWIITETLLTSSDDSDPYDDSDLLVAAPVGATLFPAPAPLPQLDYEAIFRSIMADEGAKAAIAKSGAEAVTASAAATAATAAGTASATTAAASKPTVAATSTVNPGAATAAALNFTTPVRPTTTSSVEYQDIERQKKRRRLV